MRIINVNYEVYFSVRIYDIIKDKSALPMTPTPAQLVVFKFVLGLTYVQQMLNNLIFEENDILGFN